jgi:hypothetical protein
VQRRLAWRLDLNLIKQELIMAIEDLMTAAVLDAPGAAFRNVPVARAQAEAGQVLVRVRASGVNPLIPKSVLAKPPTLGSRCRPSSASISPASSNRWLRRRRIPARRRGLRHDGPVSAAIRARSPSTPRSMPICWPASPACGELPRPAANEKGGAEARPRYNRASAPKMTTATAPMHTT